MGEEGSKVSQVSEVEEGGEESEYKRMREAERRRGEEEESGVHYLEEFRVERVNLAKRRQATHTQRPRKRFDRGPLGHQAHAARVGLLLPQLLGRLEEAVELSERSLHVEDPRLA